MEELNDLEIVARFWQAMVKETLPPIGVVILLMFSSGLLHENRNARSNKGANTLKIITV